MREHSDVARARATCILGFSPVPPLPEELQLQAQLGEAHLAAPVSTPMRASGSLRRARQRLCACLGQRDSAWGDLAEQCGRFWECPDRPSCRIEAFHAVLLKEVNS